MPWRHKAQAIVCSLKRLDELLGLNRRWVDDLIDVFAVAVCIGGGDVNEGLEVVHLLGQAEELLRGDHVQLQGVPVGDERDSEIKSVCSGREGEERVRR